MRIYILQILSFILIVFGEVAWSATNSIWFQKYDPSVIHGKSFTPEQFFSVIQSESRRIDPQGCGVKILYGSAQIESERIQLTFSSNETLQSLIEILYSGIELIGLQCSIIDNVALVGRSNTRGISVIISGRCYDAIRGTPVNHFKIESSPWNGELNIESNGQYTFSLPCQVRLNICDGVIYFPIESPGWEQEFTVWASGYKPRKYTINALQPGNTPVINIDIELEKTGSE